MVCAPNLQTDLNYCMNQHNLILIPATFHVGTSPQFVNSNTSKGKSLVLIITSAIVQHVFHICKHFTCMNQHNLILILIVFHAGTSPQFENISSRGKIHGCILIFIYVTFTINKNYRHFGNNNCIWSNSSFAINYYGFNYWTTTL